MYQVSKAWGWSVMATFSTQWTQLATRLSSITTAITGQTTIGSGMQSVLLMMVIKMPETCWDNINNKSPFAASSWSHTYLLINDAWSLKHKLHSMLTSALDDSKRQALWPCHFTPRKRALQYPTSRRAGVDALDHKKTFFPSRNQTTKSQMSSLCPSHYTNCTLHS